MTQCSGIPKYIVSDQAVQFTLRVWQSFMKKCGVSVSLTYRDSSR